MTVEILNTKFPAILDTGSTVSIIGDDLIKLVKKHKIAITSIERKINFVSGSLVATERVVLTIKHQYGQRRHSFLIVPGALKSVLLGTDFIGPEDIGIHIGRGGYSLGTETQALLPFVSVSEIKNLTFNKESRKISEQRTIEKTRDSDDDSDTEIDYDALFSWALNAEMEDQGSDSDELEEDLESLYPDKNEYLLIPQEMDEYKKEALRQALMPLLGMFSPVPGLCTRYEHTIDTGDAKPIRAKLIPVSKGMRKAFDETFDELLKHDIIEPSKSPWSSTAFLVPKPDGSMRFVVNYKPLNAVTVLDTYPVPSIEEILTFLGEARYFSTFDLAKGFFQIAVAIRDRPKTAFISHRGLYQFKRLPNGPCNGPPTFQRTIDEILEETKYVFNIAYFDDVIDYSKTFEDHVLHVVDTLTRLSDAGFTIHPKKVQLCRRRLKFLGYIIEPGKCSPNPEKVEKIKNYPVPKTPTCIKKFLGMLSYYRKFIPHFANYAKPMYALLKKETEFVWSEQCQSSFEFLRDALCGTVELYLPDLNLEFIITCDASRKGLAAILSQEKDGIRYPVWFASRTLRPPETRYSVSEIELLAVLFGVQKFRQYIELTHFVVETDHIALKWLRNIKEPAGRLAKWFMILQEFNFTVRYKPGASSCIKTADALSRTEEILVTELAPQLDRQLIIQEQDADEFLGNIKRYLRKEDITNLPNYDRIVAHSERAYLVEDGLLWRFVGSKDKPWEEESFYYRIWIPKSLTQMVISQFHDDPLAGHVGRRKTYQKLEDRVFWLGMAKAVGAYVRKCSACAKAKPTHFPPVPSTSYVPDAPWEICSIDLAGPYCKGSKQTTVLLIVLDVYTKWLEIFPLRAATASKVIDCLNSCFCRFGFPRVLISDNGSQFISKAYTDWCKLKGITPFHQSPYHACSNPTERYIGSVKGLIRALITQTKEWDMHLNEVSFALRTAVNESTGFSPAYLMFLREPRTPFDNLVGSNTSHIKNAEKAHERMTLVLDLAKESMLVSQDDYLRYKNAKAKERSFDVGDKVWMRTHILSDKAKGISVGLAPKREGPYKILFKVSEHVYDLENIENSQKVFKIHVNDLSPCYD